MKQIARTAPDTMAPCSVPSRALDDKYDFISRSKTATSPPPPRFSKTHSLHTAANVCLAASARFFVEDRADEGRFCSATCCERLSFIGRCWRSFFAPVCKRSLSP